MEMILDVQGFQHPINEFVLKELAAITIQAYETGEQGLTRILFKPPCAWKILSAKCRAVNSWLMRNHHGIPWNAGIMSYDKVQEVVRRIVENASYIYVKGKEKKEWIKKIINDESKPVIDLEELNCPSFRRMRDYEVLHWHEDNHGNLPRYHCAFENVQRLKTWYLKECKPCLYKSLIMSIEVGGLKRMKAEDIAYLTKDFILIYGSSIIDEVWDKLSEAMKKDADIANCRRCKIHYGSQSGEFNESTPMIGDCSQCQMIQ